MSFIFTDRESGYPNRYLVTPETGNPYYIILERADDPVVVGTPLNAETFNALIADLYANAGISPPEKAVVGQYIRVKSVDENGEILETETATAVEESPAIEAVVWVKTDNEIGGLIRLADGSIEEQTIVLTAGSPTAIVVGGTTIPLGWEGFDDV